MLLDCFLKVPFDAKSNVDTAINETWVEENKCINM